jgi:hypothetical protein
VEVGVVVESSKYTYICVLSAELVFLSSLWGPGLMIKKLMMDGEFYLLESM